MNKTLNGYGYVARGVSSRYVIGRSRSLAEIAPHLSNPGTLEIRPDGIFLDHSRKISTNPFLIEAFLKHAITKIDITDALSYKELSLLSRGELAAGDNFKIIENPGQAEKSLPEIEKRNNEQVMRLNALAAIYGGLAYSAYKIATLAASVGALDAVDLVCSSVITFGTLAFASVNLIKQKFVANSPKYADPIVTQVERESVIGKAGPKVTVLVPAFNEPVEVLRKTLSAASRLNYANYEVVLLLDSRPDSQNYREVMDMYESEFRTEGRVKVFSRKKYANVSNQKLNKADNINAFINSALGKNLEEKYEDGEIRLAETEGAGGMRFMDSEIVLITDADYRLKPEFLEETVPLLTRDERNAYVMTPQNFALGEGNAVERANAALMSSSWQVINKGVAHSARVLFGGCNSIIRVKTLKEVATVRETGEVDYLPTDTVTEDLALTLKFIERGDSSIFVSKPLAVGDPIGSLGDHFSTFWRYSEGSIENTLKYTIPFFREKKMSALSMEGMDYLFKALNPIFGAGIALISLGPLAAYEGIQFPASSPIVPLIYYLLLSNAAKGTLTTQGEKDPWAAAKLFSLMYMHFPVFVHATYTAIKNYLTGNEARFRTTTKDGSRTRLSLGYLLPLLGVFGANIYAMAGHFNEFLNTHELWRLETATWAALPVVTIGYGLSHFNGVKNTLADLGAGLGFDWFDMKRHLKEKYASVVTSNVFRGISSIL